MALPNYRVEIQKQLGEQRWYNTYLIIGADMDDAAATADALVELERRLHRANVTIVYSLISTITIGDRIFRHRSHNVPGSSAVGSDDFLPLFCVMRVDLSTIDSDPCRKYYRLPIAESQVTNGQFTSTFITDYTAVFNTYLMGTVAGDNIESAKGNVITGFTIYPFLQERQLRRHRRKKVVGADPPA